MGSEPTRLIPNRFVSFNLSSPIRLFCRSLVFFSPQGPARLVARVTKVDEKVDDWVEASAVSHEALPNDSVVPDPADGSEHLQRYTTACR